MTPKTAKPTRIRSLASLTIVIVGLVIFMSGCNLTIDFDDYPYSGREDVQDVSDDSGDTADTTDAADTEDTRVEDAADTQMDTSDTTDAEPSDRPVLIFTEVMPDSSVEGTGSVEYGEFIEVKNVGKVAADPRRIVIELEDANRRIAIDPFPSDPEEQEVFDELKPIQPGEYFVFVRQDSDYYRITSNLEAGTFYEYGRWNEQVPLANNERTLTLFYRLSEFEADVTDKIEWVSRSLIDPSLQTAATLEIREDVALGVREVSESQAGNDSPSNWCYHADTIEGSPVKASPGGPTPATCTVD
ncbi:MAG: hypothetical protein ACQEVA_15815 [Myxococcota bacterium]